MTACPRVHVNLPLDHVSCVFACPRELATARLASLEPGYGPADQTEPGIARPLPSPALPRTHTPARRCPPRRRRRCRAAGLEERRGWCRRPQALILEGAYPLPRLRVLLTFFRSDPSVKPVDEWRLKRALLDFLSDSLSLQIPDDDLLLRRRPDLHKRKRDEPVASGTLLVRNLPNQSPTFTFHQWRDSVVSRLHGIELNTEGVIFRLSAELPPSDDFDTLKSSWEEFFLSSRPSNHHHHRHSKRRPDTIVVKGLPSRWFAETRVSSKPSMLVTHTIFSVLGKIRNLNIAGEDGVGKASGEADANIISGLHCKIWVQFENYNDFCYALSALCGRSLQKEGSRLKADYEVACDTEGYFRNVTHLDKAHTRGERVSQSHVPPRHVKMEASRPQLRSSRFDSEDTHPRRFREKRANGV